MPVALTLRASEREGLEVYPLALSRSLGVDAMVTGRRGGVSRAPFDELNLASHVGDEPVAVGENRRRVARALGVDPSQLVTSSQVHGARVNIVDYDVDDRLVGDALVTTRDDLAVAILVADCVPLLLVDRGQPRLAVVHAGWRGLVAGVISATVQHFSSPSNVVVVVGPHVSSAQYQVGPDVAQHFATIRGALLGDRGDRHRLDLTAVTLHQLHELGVRDENIKVCTQTTDGGRDFFSDRAERPSGRFALVARRTPDGDSRQSTACDATA